MTNLNQNYDTSKIVDNLKDAGEKLAGILLADLEKLDEFSDHASIVVATKKIDQLHRLGYIQEAHAQLTSLGRIIRGSFNHMFDSWRFFAKQFTGYSIPSELDHVTPNKLITKYVKLEDHREDKGVIIVLYFHVAYPKEVITDDHEQHECMIITSDLYNFAVAKGYITATKDTVDRSGEHLQKDLKIPFYSFIQEKLDKIIVDYIQSGKEVFVTKEVRV